LSRMRFASRRQSVEARRGCLDEYDTARAAVDLVPAHDILLSPGLADAKPLAVENHVVLDDAPFDAPQSEADVVPPRRRFAHRRPPLARSWCRPRRRCHATGSPQR
jgi:hypothetical protein